MERYDHKSIDEKDGYGLSLYLAKAEIEAMGRDIDIREAWAVDEKRIVETILKMARNE